ncbi:MAG: prepilin-type N-terminal cleavage/methylation domain-containing protein, partial [Gemmatimonadetes bacterium]|nr:prepilin-type N-terminal cleavage/methylation domain-containing protein [Gemmatimonadota bacterium]
MERRSGYTLPEMVFVVALVAATLGYGIPAFRDLGLDTARTREVNAFVHALYLARSEAIKRNGVV